MIDDNAPARKSHRRMLEALGGSQTRREEIQAQTATYDPNAPQGPAPPPPEPLTEGTE